MAGFHPTTIGLVSPTITKTTESAITPSNLSLFLHTNRNLIMKGKLERDDKFKNFLTPVTEFRRRA